METEDIKIENMIYEIRGKQVMFVSDVAQIYNSKTKVVNQAIKRNIERFPEEFYFQLTILEWKSLRSQIVTSSNKANEITHGGVRYLPYVLTEHGIIMLSGILKSDIAIKMNIRIINAFVAMRKYISTNLIEHSKMLINHENRLALLENTFDSFKDKNILDILSETNRKVTLVTNKYNNIDYEKYKEQYNNVTLVVNNSFHDRFIILDKSILYHFGASFKDLG